PVVTQQVLQRPGGDVAQHLVGRRVRCEIVDEGPGPLGVFIDQIVQAFPGPEIVLISGPTLGVSYPAAEEYARGAYCVRPRTIAAEGGLPRPVPGPENEPVRPAHIVAPHTEQKTKVVHVTLVQQRVLAGVLLEEADLLLFGVGAVDSEGADGIV